jgi:ectoine hydroxylase-related dioxygenase (phytanoyl-CoA dioxygenase family)
MNLPGNAQIQRMTNALIYQPLFGRLVLLPILRVGLKNFKKNGRNGKPSYIAMRKLFGNKDARLFEKIAAEAKTTAENLTSTQRFAGLAAEEIDHVVRQLREEGYCILSKSLDEQMCLELEQIARTAVCELIDTKSNLTHSIYDESNPVAVRYEIPEDQIIQSSAAQRIICDSSLHEVAKQYLECEPVQDLVAMWWSTSINTEASSAAAQQFHFDLDRIKFLKLFVYLSDVNENNGPHVYVPTSHRNLPMLLRRDGRHSDQEVKEQYRREVSVTGERGLVFLADTRGLHKGLPLESGHRLMFQTEYANSLFGYPHKHAVLRNPEQTVRAITESNPGFLERFVLEETM